MAVVSFHALPLTLADIRDEETKVIIWCLHCNRHQTMLVYFLRKLMGPVAFGTINGRLGCRGCGLNMGIVLPPEAPTPESWARAYRPAASDREPHRDIPESNFPFHVELWGKHGGVERYMGQVVQIAAANAVFDIALPTLDKSGERHITIRHQGRVLRDSRRDFKVVRPEDG